MGENRTSRELDNSIMVIFYDIIIFPRYEKMAICISQEIHGVIITSLSRQNGVAMSFDVIRAYLKHHVSAGMIVKQLIPCIEIYR